MPSRTNILYSIGVQILKSQQNFKDLLKILIKRTQGCFKDKICSAGFGCNLKTLNFENEHVQNQLTRTQIVKLTIMRVL